MKVILYLRIYTKHTQKRVKEYEAPLAAPKRRGPNSKNRKCDKKIPNYIINKWCISKKKNGL